MVSASRERPHQPARLRAHVGAAMAPDLGLVADAAQGDPDELAPEGAGHRLAERGLAHPGRPDQGQDGPGAAPVDRHRGRARHWSLRTDRCWRMRSFTSTSPSWSSSRIAAAAGTSKRSSDSTPQGISRTVSSHVRIQPCSGLCSLVRSSLSISRSIAARGPSRAGRARPGRAVVVRAPRPRRRRARPSSLRIASSWRRSRNSRWDFSIPSSTSFLIRSRSVRSARVSLAQPRTSAQACRDVEGLEHLDLLGEGEVGRVRRPGRPAGRARSPPAAAPRPGRRPGSKGCSPAPPGTRGPARPSGPRPTRSRPPARPRPTGRPRSRARRCRGRPGAGRSRPGRAARRAARRARPPRRPRRPSRSGRRCGAPAAGCRPSAPTTSAAARASSVSSPMVNTIPGKHHARAQRQHREGQSLARHVSSDRVGAPKRNQGSPLTRQRRNRPGHSGPIGDGDLNGRAIRTEQAPKRAWTWWIRVPTTGPRASACPRATRPASVPSHPGGTAPGGTRVDPDHRGNQPGSPRQRAARCEHYPEGW